MGSSRVGTMMIMLTRTGGGYWHGGSMGLSYWPSHIGIHPHTDIFLIFSDLISQSIEPTLDFQRYCSDHNPQK